MNVFTLETAVFLQSMLCQPLAPYKKVMSFLCASSVKVPGELQTCGRTGIMCQQRWFVA